MTAILPKLREAFDSNNVAQKNIMLRHAFVEIENADIALCKFLAQKGIATGHGDTLTNLIKQLDEAP